MRNPANPVANPHRRARHLTERRSGGWSDPMGSSSRSGFSGGLPDGLSEDAMRVVDQMQFKPAMKDGHAVAFGNRRAQLQFEVRDLSGKSRWISISQV